MVDGCSCGDDGYPRPRDNFADDGSKSPLSRRRRLCDYQMEWDGSDMNLIDVSSDFDSTTKTMMTEDDDGARHDNHWHEMKDDVVVLDVDEIREVVGRNNVLCRSECQILNFLFKGHLRGRKEH